MGSHCINHYQDVSCDCYGTEYEGERCDIYSEFRQCLRAWTRPWESRDT